MSYRCYYYEGLIQYKTLMGIFALFLTCFMYLSSVNFWKNNYKIETLILFFTCLSGFISMFHEGVGRFTAYLPYLSFIAIFYILKKTPSISTIENILVVSAIIYLCCWLYQVSQMPHTVFVTSNSEFAGNDDRGFYRFYIETKEHLPFLIFYLLALFNRKRNPILLFLALLVLIVVLLHVVRQMVFWACMLAIIYLVVTNKKRIGFLVIIGSLALCVYIYYISKSEVFLQLSEITMGKQYGVNNADFTNVRIEAMAYFIQDGCSDFSSFLFGKGMPATGTDLSHSLRSAMSKSYILEDVGFVAIFWHFGIIVVVLYLILLYNVIFRTIVDSRYLYLKYYLGYLTLSFVGSHALTSNLIFVVLSIYILKRKAVKSILIKRSNKC